jgi:hypothetical protein
MPSTRALGLGLIGAAATMIARRATRRALHDETGAPRLPGAARRADSLTTLILVAIASGALLALGDVLQEQRKQLAEFN